ncbi:MAG: tRNA (adenosine(37)-N6)-threonylcarbamoyltransferase complex ATPase subunit type 1 TsaE [Tistlia sp.]|uniref:tRNA (adenosine(37)-N6)-threonylcarbamoyltransferase complex ATPase subunit type 1 TsaE n=1 Tax=Tistlia sp. TaxID=3057121 RepID=UPI0034A2EA66
MPSPSQPAVELPDEAATSAFAARIAPLLRVGDLLYLEGDLGAGKTAFARALINALPGPREEVPSPTFTLVQTYPRDALEIWHFDLYRLERAEEVWELGLEEALVAGASLVEWPERAGSLLPAERLVLRFAHAGTGRRLTLEPHGGWAERLRALAP